MTATINGKRRLPHDLSASARLPLSLGAYLRLFLSFCLPFAHLLQAHALEHPHSPLSSPLFFAAAVSLPPPVKDKLPRPSFLLLWFTRGSPSLCYRRISSPAPVGAAPRPHRSATQPTAIAKLLLRRIPFAFELACLSFAR
jgi:hypothetical protein